MVQLTEPDLACRRGDYGEDKKGQLWWIRRDREGNPFYEQLTNFSAKINEEITEDDGFRQRRFFVVMARVPGRDDAFEVKVPAAKFGAMGWVAQDLGAKAVIYSGRKDRAKVAIQMLSGELKKTVVHTHTGWAPHGNESVFLTESGALGQKEFLPSPIVSLGELSGYRLPDCSSASKNEAKGAIRASLDILNVGPPTVMVPLLAAAYRAPIQSSDFGLFLEGDSGLFKSAITALVQQHFGATMDDRNFPASWASTENALEVLAFLAKDVVFTIDDFKPAGSKFEIQQMHNKAERIFRGLGNSAGRQRLTSAGELRQTRFPRGLIVSSGEDVPKGKSLRARMLILGIEKGTIDMEALTDCQDLARKGVYATAMSLYLSWLATMREHSQIRLRNYVAGARTKWAAKTTHKRTPDIIGNLLFGFKSFLDFARAEGVITGDHHEAHMKDAESAFRMIAAAQSQRQLDADEVSQFFTLLKTAIATGLAHVVGWQKGEEPPESEKWGWQTTDRLSEYQGRGGVHRRKTSMAFPRGTKVGWIDETDDLYLAPDAAYAVAQSLARKQDGVLSMSLTTLKKRLKERGLLVTEDTKTKRKTITVRKTVQGMRLEVLHITSETLQQKTATDINEPSRQAA